MRPAADFMRVATAKHTDGIQTAERWAGFGCARGGESEAPEPLLYNK